MAFCTKCGANVTGVFCQQCGTPAAGAAAAAPPPPVPYGQPPVTRKTSPLVWVLVIVLGIFVLGGLGVAAIVGMVRYRIHQAGVSFDRGRDGRVTVHGKDGTVEIGGSDAKLPDWVPVYPGSEGRAKFAMHSSGGSGEEGGVFQFTTTDSADRVKSFYQGKCKDLGLTVNMDTTTSEGGVMIAAEDGGERRSLTVTVGGHSGQTSVNVMYGRK
jgi:hypothetical protein